MEPHVLVPLLGGVVLGAVGVAMGFYLRLMTQRTPDPATLTFHRPRAHALVVEVRANLRPDEAKTFREWLIKHEPPETEVLVVCIDPNRRYL